MNDICFTVAGLLTERECLDLITWGEDGRYQDMAGYYPPSYRNNDRLLLDDPDLAKLLFERLKSRLPKVLSDGQSLWYLKGFNSRFRGCRYTGGQNFTRHRDGAYSPDEQTMSLLTVMLYLNDHQEFEGGATRFFCDRFTAEPDFEIKPKQGRAIIFSHNYWHDGQAVTQGNKYVLRTDVLYQRESAASPGKHRGYIWDMVCLPDGRLATGSRDKTVRIWNEDRTLECLEAHEASVSCLAADQRGLVSGSRDCSIVFWQESARGFSAEKRWKAHEGAVLCLHLEDEGQLWSCGADGMVKLWNEDFSLRKSWELGSWVWAVQRVGDALLFGTESGELHQLREQKSEVVFRTGSPILSLARLPGDIILLGCADSSIRVLSPQFEELAQRLAHRGQVTSLLALENGCFVSGAEDDGVRLWTATESTELTRHSDFVRALCLTDDQRVASASYDGSLRFSNPSVILSTLR